MPYVPVPKDLSRVKNKLVFNLTKRQLICFGGAALVGIPFYLLTRKVIGTDIAALSMIALMFPFFAVGMYEKDGQSLEKIVYHYIRARFLSKRVRPYKTNNSYAALMRQAKFDKEVAIIEAKNKKHDEKNAEKEKAISHRGA